MEDTKNRIMDIAKVRFERFGFKKTTLDEICSDARVSKKTLYKFFRDKEDFFVSLFNREALKSRKITLRRLKNIEDPLEKIKQFMEVSREHFKEEPFMVTALRDEDGLYAPFLKEKYQVFVEEGILNILAGFLREGIEQGKIRNLDTHINSYIIFKLFQAFTYAKTMPLSNDKKGEKKELDELLAFISRALTKR
jgi:AcrR family transcriptional regulator